MNHVRKITLIATLLISILTINFTIPQAAFAQLSGAKGTGGAASNTGGLFCGGGQTSISTAIGCIPVLGGQNEFIAFILRWAIGIGGGIAFLLIVYAGFMIMTSSGNPERLKAGQELLTSAISGIVLLIFSVFILNFIGVKILKIPGFS